MEDIILIVSQIISFSQRLQSTYAILRKDIDVSEEELQILKNALDVIKDIDKRIKNS